MNWNNNISQTDWFLQLCKKNSQVTSYILQFYRNIVLINCYTPHSVEITGFYGPQILREINFDVFLEALTFEFKKVLQFLRTEI